MEKVEKSMGEYRFTKSQGKVNYLMYLDDIQIFTKNLKKLETLIKAFRIYWQDIRMKFGIEKCTMLIINKMKRETK